MIRLEDTLSIAKENITFVLMCIGIFAALFIISLIAQRIFKNNLKKVSKTKYISFIAMFSAIGGVLMLIEIPLFFAPSFYKIDLGELPVMMCSLYLGPCAGVISELLKVVIKILLKGTSTAFVGDFANFAVGCSLILPVSIIYLAKKTKRNAVIGMIVGVIVLTAFGSLFNAVYLLPKFAVIYGMPLEAIVAMGNAVNSNINSVATLALFAVVPFNLLKGTVISILTFFIYKRLEKVLFKNEKK